MCPSLLLRGPLVGLLFVLGCTEVRFVTHYDERTDESLHALQEDIEVLLTTLERTLGTPEGEHAEYAEWYDGLRVQLHVLQVRAEARTQNRLQVDQLALVEANLDLFEQAHREGMAPEEIGPFRAGFHQSFRAMIALELAKKRGDA